DHPRAFERDRRGAQVLEQADAVAEQDGHQVDPDLVKQPGLEALLHDVRAADGDILVPGGFLCLTNGALHAVGDEGEGRSFPDPFLWGGMGDDETRSPPRWVAMPRIGD